MAIFCPPYQTVLLILLLAACQRPVQTEQATAGPVSSESELAAPKPTRTSVDTIYMENAPSRITRKIRKDSKGHLLFAAYTEVIFYDGSSFSSLPPLVGFESLDAFDALEDSKGHIWIGSTHHGVFRYDGRDYTHFSTENGLLNNRTIDLYEDRKGQVWIATMGGLSCFDGQAFRHLTTNQGLSDNDVNTIMEDKTGTIWIGTRGAVCKYDGQDISKISPQNGQYLSNIRHIMEDQHGNIWLGGQSGLWRYNGQSFTQLSKEMIAYVYEDANGHIWTTGTSASTKPWGLARYAAVPTADLMTKVEDIKTADSMLFGISEDQKGNIWVGTLNGVFSYNGTSRTYYLNKH
ncbi:MAG: two-component regulator propeller domain-containing protein [Bacteroidota bacterium]